MTKEVELMERVNKEGMFFEGLQGDILYITSNIKKVS
jgi:hypothetical protein